MTATGYVLAVQTGLYAGVTLTFAGGRTTIGQGRDVDLVLLEDSIAAEHAAITPAGSRLRVEALAPDVTVDGMLLAAGADRIAALPAQLALGSIVIVVSTRDDPAEDARRASNARGSARRTLIGVAVLSLAALVLAGTFLLQYQAATPIALSAVTIKPNPPAPAPGRAPPRPDLPAAPPRPIEQPALPAQPILPTRRALDATAPTDVSEAANRLRTALAALPSLKVVADGETIRVEGVISTADVPRWREIAQSFDRDHRGRILLVRQFEEKAPTNEPLPKIEAIWTGQPPYIIIGGRRHYRGARLDRGWVFEGIENGQVVLTLNGRRATLSAD